MVKRADFNVWNNAHRPGWAHLTPNSEAARRWMREQGGDALGSTSYVFSHADLASFVPELEAAGLVVAYGQPAY